MSDETFDPFALASSFDPLGREAPPPPRRRRVGASPGPPPCDPPEIGAGGRLAHLFDQRGQSPTAGGLGRSPCKAKAETEDTAAWFEVLEDEIAILTARLGGLEATVTSRLEEQQRRIVQAVAALIDARLKGRG